MVEKVTETDRKNVEVFDSNSIDSKFLKLFDAKAFWLMNEVLIVAGKEKYRVVECEIYYHDEQNHPDPYVYPNEEATTDGNWYFNRKSGIDLTFGFKKGNNKIYGGILIRGIRSESNKGQVIKGPIKVLDKIFLNDMGNIYSIKEAPYFVKLNKEEFYKDVPIKTKRIGLRKKENDKDDFISKPYRFFIEEKSK